MIIIHNGLIISHNFDEFRYLFLAIRSVKHNHNHPTQCVSLSHEKTVQNTFSENKLFQNKTMSKKHCGQCLPPSAILVLSWSALVYAHYIFWRYFMLTAYDNDKSRTSNITQISFIIGYVAIFMAFPLIGLISDVCTGRHKTICTGMYFCFTSWIIAGIGYLLINKIPLKVPDIASYILQMTGYAAVHANIVQYNIDQLVGAPSTQLSAVIYWHAASVPTTFVFFQLGECLLHKDTFLIISYIVSGLSITSVIVSHSFLQQILEKNSLIANPVKLIFNVLCYAMKHKFPENRSALTYWEEEAPSRLDLGKDKYGGPFTIEEVENVKTVLQMIPLLIASVGTGCADEVYWAIMIAGENNHTNTPFLSCAINKDMMKFVTTSVILVCYKLLPKKSVHKYTPSILRRIGIGLSIGLLSVISYAVIFQFKSADTVLLFIPAILFGISYALEFTLLLEFTIAQCPVEMRGILVGLWYASRGIGYAFNIILKFPFGCDNETLCTKPYYYISKSALVAVCLTMFVIVAAQYKYRVRDNDINVLKVVEDYYQKYTSQEEEEEQ